METGIIQQKTQQTKQQATSLDNLKRQVENNKDSIIACIPNDIDKDRFYKTIQIAITNNPKLADCTVSSVLTSFMLSAQLGLEPNNSALGETWIIPYGKEAQFQLGYQGLLTLAHRNPKVISAHAEVVYENDSIEINLGSDPYVNHKPHYTGLKGKVMGFYAVIKLINNGTHIVYMSKEDMDAFRQKNTQSSNKAWINHYETMAKKTVLKRALKFAPRNAEMVRAIAMEDEPETTNHNNFESDENIIDTSVVENE